MAPRSGYEQDKLKSRMKKVTEMRNELRRLEAALIQVEMAIRQPKTNLGALRAAAIPLRGWAQSIVESYVVLEHVLSDKTQATIATGQLHDLIRKTADRFSKAVIEPDPQPYYPDMIDRYG